MEIDFLIRKDYGKILRGKVVFVIIFGILIIYLFSIRNVFSSFNGRKLKAKLSSNVYM